MGRPAPTHPERLEAGDPIRVVATFAVVLQHVAHASFRHPALVDRGEWALATIVVGLTKWAVPVFVMLSGALLLAPRAPETLDAFYRKRLSRVGVPLLFWTAFYLSLRAVSSTDDERSTQLLALLVRGRPYYHMFFMFVIVGLYAFTPFLRRFVHNASRAEQGLAVALSLGVAVGSVLLGRRCANALTLFVPYVGYFLAGWWIRDGARASAAAWPWPAYAGATLVFVVGSLILNDPTGPATLYLHHYQSVPLVAMSLGIFALMLVPGRFGSMQGRFSRLCVWLSPLTLGIYLIHPAVLKAVSLATGIDGASGSVWITLPLLALFAFASSALLTALLRSFRAGAAVVGG